MTKTFKQKAMWEIVKFMDESKKSLLEVEKRLRTSMGFKLSFIVGFALIGYLPHEFRKVFSEKQPSFITLANKSLTRSEEKKKAMKEMFDE